MHVRVSYFSGVHKRFLISRHKECIISAKLTLPEAPFLPKYHHHVGTLEPLIIKGKIWSKNKVVKHDQKRNPDGIMWADQQKFTPHWRTNWRKYLPTVTGHLMSQGAQVIKRERAGMTLISRRFKPQGWTRSLRASNFPVKFLKELKLMLQLLKKVTVFLIQ